MPPNEGRSEAQQSRQELEQAFLEQAKQEGIKWELDRGVLDLQDTLTILGLEGKLNRVTKNEDKPRLTAFLGELKLIVENYSQRLDNIRLFTLTPLLDEWVVIIAQALGLRRFLQVTRISDPKKSKKDSV